MPYAALFSSSSSLAAQPPPSVISHNSRCRQREARIPTGEFESPSVCVCVVSFGVVAADFCDGPLLLLLLEPPGCLCPSGEMLVRK